MAVASCSLKRYVERATVVKMSFGFFSFLFAIFKKYKGCIRCSFQLSFFLKNGESHLAPDFDNYSSVLALKNSIQRERIFFSPPAKKVYVIYFPLYFILTER